MSIRQLAIAATLVGGLLGALAPEAFADGRPKVVVLGFDGADSKLVETWMNEGHLPNLDALRRDGTFAPLQPTNPPQTPVSWSAFATGTNPGKTEIFDFLKRDPNDYLPDFAMMSESRKTFLFGESNGLAVGGIVAAAVLLAVFLLSFAIRMPIALRAGIALVLAAGAGIPAGLAATQYLPVEVPTAINNRRGQTLWSIAADAGYKVQVIRVPATFPADEFPDGRMLSGLGVPDMRGRVGTPAFYTSDPTFDPKDANQFSLELIRLPARRGKIETRLIGPYNKPFYDYVVDRRTRGIADPRERSEEQRRIRHELDDRDVPRRIDLPMLLEVADDSVTVEVSGQRRTLAVGEWSDWFVLDFPVNPVVDFASPLRGAARMKLLTLDPELELYVSPINFHPDCHPIAFSWPTDYSEELLERFGMYKTLGWALDTWSEPSGVGDETLFLEDMNFTVDKYEEIMKGLLADGDDDVYIQIFYFTDRIGHLFWQYLDPQHPLYDPEKAEKFAPEMLRAYERMDEIVGKARELAGSDALFIVLSDHGFSSFRRGVNYNTWLVRNGFMTLKGQEDASVSLEQLFDTRDLFGNVDWSKTKAYAIGLGAIYINLVGRERDGIVMPGAEYDEVCREIREGLAKLEDEDGSRPVTRVVHRDDIYNGYDPDLIPDLRACNNLGYRVGWQSTLGGVPPDILEDNTSPWSGDHCSNDPDLVPGIFFINRKIRTDRPSVLDVMPTVLDVLGIPAPDAVDGTSLVSGP